MKSKPQLVSMEFPRMVVKVDLVGTNSLVGALCDELIKRNCIQDIGLLKPDEIVFEIKNVHPQVNLYDEIDKVRDLFKINETKITIFMLNSWMKKIPV